MLVWSDNQIPKFSEGYGYTPECLWEHIGPSGLPIRRNQPSMPEEIGRLQANVPGLGYFQRGHFADEIVINHSVPDMFVRSNIYSIGYTFWETNRLPDDWVERCNEMDEIWTTTHAMRDVFINSGVNKPVYEFKLGVDPKIYYPKKRKPHNQFTFLSVGSPATRKNSQMAVDAFLKLFNGNRDYKLIYKSNGPPDARIRTDGMIGPISHSQIELIDDEVSHERLGEIYDMADCLIFPTSGEGWGNIPFQGIAKGIPTICTNVLACSDFAHFSVPLDFTWGTKNMSGRYANAGQWGEPSFDDLCDKMLYVANNYKEVSDKTYQSAEYINQNMTWEKVSQKYIARCWEILKDTNNL